MEARIKFILLLILALMWGGAQWAKAAEDFSAATDNENIQLQVETNNARWEQEQQAQMTNRKHKQKHQRMKSHKEEEIPPCAADYDCGSTKMDAVDRENGKGGQED